MAEGRFVKVEAWLFERLALPAADPLHLTPMQACVWLRLAWYAGEKAEAWASQKRLAADLGCTDRGVRKAIDALVRQGLLVRNANQVRGRGNLYELRPPCASQRNGGSSIREATHEQRNEDRQNTADPSRVTDRVTDRGTVVPLDRGTVVPLDRGTVVPPEVDPLELDPENEIHRRARERAREHTRATGAVRAAPPTDATTAGEWMVAHVAELWSAPIASGGLGREGSLPQEEHVGLRRAGVLLWEGVRHHVITSPPEPLDATRHASLILERTSKGCSKLGPVCVERWARSRVEHGLFPGGGHLVHVLPELLAELLAERRKRAPRAVAKADGPSAFEGARGGAVLVKQQVRLAPGEDLPAATGTADA